jgi:deazaflavin-dependent oxidoreductase (nitroreductase family)
MKDWRSDPAGFNESVITEFRANRGVVGGELADMQLLLLTTVGARSGEPRTTPLAYHRRGNRFLVIASNGGAVSHPSWFRNLERNPNVRIEVGLDSFLARANILARRRARRRLRRHRRQGPCSRSIPSQGRPNDPRDRARALRRELMSRDGDEVSPYS